MLLYFQVNREETQPYIYMYPFSRTIVEKAMASHSSTLAWRFPGMGEPGGLPSMGWHTVRHN